MMSGSKMTLEEALKEIETLKLELELAKACHNEKCAEFNKLCFDYAKLQVKNEKFERNMKNVLEIEKKNAVKEFAEKVKRLLHNDYIMPDGNTDERFVFECIDELLKECLNDFSKS